MISQTRQRFAMGGMVAVALLAIVLASIYQDDNKLNDVRIVGAGPASTASGASGPAGNVAPASGPIEGYLPQSGEASACSEQVGVDLSAGFGARLTINGIEIPPEAMNVNLTETGEISPVITASRSLGQYTFEPDENCPNGSLLRPLGNVLGVCVYRLSDVTQTCAFNTEHIFDAL